ncbi:RNA-directed DNA polymerase from mobile element jockey [Nymphon striatum]|nr:RNA-directed DNA polymerase from mobile element jockey [Nymphon striatum]
MEVVIPENSPKCKKRGKPPKLPILPPDHFPIHVKGNGPPIKGRPQRWKLHKADWTMFKQLCAEQLNISSFAEISDQYSGFINILLESFCKNSSSENCTGSFRSYKNRAESHQLDFKTTNTEVYNQVFSLEELRRSLRASKDTAPGPDSIHYQMLKHLPDCSLALMLNIFNTIWITGAIPCICKTMERMINCRLTYYLESNNILTRYQSGFRRHRSTIDHLVRFETLVREAFVRREHLAAVFFDLEKAYETTWKYGILRDLFNSGLRGRMPIFIKHFLTNRKFRVRVGITFSDYFDLEMGVPQGSILSVTLFSLKINDIVNHVKSGTQCFLYVDDLVVAYASKSISTIERHLQLSLNKIEKWTNENGFKFSSSKTVKESILCRLRVGHSYLTHSFLLRNEAQPVCGRCQQSLTVRHVLVDCAALTSVRSRFYPPLPWEEFFEEVDLCKLFKFLKYLNVYNRMVRVGTTFSDIFDLEMGVPQGSILSVTLFSLKINDIVNHVRAELNVSSTLMTLSLPMRRKSISTIERHLQLSLNKIEKWTNENGFKFSSSKTVSMHFCLLTRPHHDPQLRLGSSPIPLVNSTRFLGLIFDKKLNFLKHMQVLKSKCLRALNLLRILSNTNWGADRKLDYGSVVYGSARKSYLRVLDPVHNQGLRLSLGAFRTTPAESLYVEAHEPSLYLRREKLSLQYACRLRANPENPCYDVTFHPNHRETFARRQNSIPTFGLRVLPLFEQIGLPLGNIARCVLPSIPPWTMHRPIINFNKSSIFSAESKALLLALDIVENSTYGRYIILSDSLSCLMALDNMKYSHPTICEILFKLHNLSFSNHVIFCWLPSHVGISGNEKADLAAKSALSLPSKWDGEINNKLHAIKPKLGEWALAYRKSRKEDSNNNDSSNRSTNSISEPTISSKASKKTYEFRCGDGLSTPMAKIKKGKLHKKNVNRRDKKCGQGNAQMNECARHFCLEISGLIRFSLRCAIARPKTKCLNYNS